jgi:deoxycytidylate deaminase
MLRNVTRLAPKLRERNQLHITIVTRGGAVVAVARNHGTVHAEYAALNKLWPSNRRGTRVYSLRIRKNGRLALAKPCPACQSLIRNSGVRAVYYSTNDGVIIRGEL